MALRLTKEVKAFAEREFDKKVREVKERFFLPVREAEKEISAVFEEEINLINQRIDELRKKYPNFQLEISTNYEHDRNARIVSGSVHSKKQPNFVQPDKVRFMAELSTGESLDDIYTLLEKFFK